MHPLPAARDKIETRRRHIWLWASVSDRCSLLEAVWSIHRGICDLKPLGFEATLAGKYRKLKEPHGTYPAEESRLGVAGVWAFKIRS